MGFKVALRFNFVSPIYKEALNCRDGSREKAEMYERSSILARKQLDRAFVYAKPLES